MVVSAASALTTLPVAFAASNIDVAFDSNGALVVSENGVSLQMTVMEESDNTLVISTGSTSSGALVESVVYLVPDPDPAPTAPTMTSGDYTDGVVAFTEEPDVVTPDQYGEEFYSPAEYDSETLIPLVGEVSTGAEVIIVSGVLPVGGDGGGGGGGTLPVEPPVVEVFKDGQHAGALDAKGTFRDNDVVPSHSYTYELVGEDGAVIVQAGAYQSQAVTSGALRNDRIWFNYKTFIPNERVSVFSGSVCRPWWTVGKIYFAGDDRSWSATSSRYRTRAQVKADFTSSSRGVYLNKWVSSTKRYKDATSTKVVASATASSKNIKLSNVKMGTSSASYRLKHDVANPLCYAAGGIWYQVDATVWRNGTASFYGHHLLAPNHEAYVVGSQGGSYQTVARRALRSFVCLNVDCGTGAWSKSFSKSVA
ncbi:DUF3238 domain-containing protein [Ornithinimicrobium avium]|uniref:DUF3238 domain-containing protein n=1 Tax=Ornithinimicrobium avium TaxID=2283195 RepID=UPI0013B37BD7|nr:DUF3238 domain-containing protein [Ornithinimicrobium avium]